MLKLNYTDKFALNKRHKFIIAHKKHRVNLLMNGYKIIHVEDKPFDFYYDNFLSLKALNRTFKIRFWFLLFFDLNFYKRLNEDLFYSYDNDIVLSEDKHFDILNKEHKIFIDKRTLKKINKIMTR